MEHLGVEKTTVGVVVPTGYSFNLDGTAIYLTMATLFIADAMGHPLAWGEQLGLLVFMMIASKGAAGVTGAGLATLAGGLQAHRPDLLDGVGLIVGIDRFMSEARAVTNFSGNAVATILVWLVDQDRRLLQGGRGATRRRPVQRADDGRRSTGRVSAEGGGGPLTNPSVGHRVVEIIDSIDTRDVGQLAAVCRHPARRALRLRASGHNGRSGAWRAVNSLGMTSSR